MTFSSRKRPLYAANLHSEVPNWNDTSGSQRDSPFEQTTNHLHTNSNPFAQRPSRSRENAARAAPERCTFRDTLHLRSTLTTAFTNGERKTLYRCIPYRCRHQAVEDSNSCGKDAEFSQKLSVPNAQLTMALMKPSRTLSQI